MSAVVGAAVRRDEGPPRDALEPELEPTPPLVHREQHRLAVRPECEDAVQARAGEEVGVGPKGVLVQAASILPERRRGGGDRTVQAAGIHARNLRLSAVGALRIERDDDVLRVTLATPETRNAFDPALIAELSEAFVDVGTCRAVVLAGEGPSFCAGADVEWMRASADLDVEANVADANAMRRMFEAIDACPAPVVAVVQGHALGGGIGLVACSDIVIAEPRAVFAFSEVKLGIVPAVISPFALRKIGESAARRYFVTGERFDAATALAIGLVQEVADDLGAALENILGELRTAGPRAARHAKRLVLERPDGPETARRIAERRTSDEGQEGLRAFLDRRTPAWAPARRDTET